MPFRVAVARCKLLLCGHKKLDYAPGSPVITKVTLSTCEGVMVFRVRPFSRVLPSTAATALASRAWPRS